MSSKAHPRFNVIAAFCGSVAEWYEFVVYGFSAPILAPLFFPEHNASVSILMALGAFAAGFCMRPLGALLYGYFGDRIGRQKTLSMSIILMGLPTVVMGLLPTYRHIGFLAPLLLILIRLLQGVSVGGQFTGSSVFISEHIRPQNRFLGGGLTFAGAFAGMLLASLVGMLLTAILTHAQLQAWGWRIPFLFGIIVSALGYYLRKRTLETPSFVSAKENRQLVHNPVVEIFISQKARMLLSALICWLAPIIVYLLFIFMPTYVHSYLQIPLAEALRSSTISMTLLTISTIFFGFAADKLGFRLVMVMAAVLLFVFSWPLYHLLALHHQNLLLIQCLFALMGGAFIGPMMTVLTFLFPVAIRYTALSFSYNLGFGIFGGTAALVATFLVHKTGNIAAPGAYVMLAALISAICVMIARPYLSKESDS
jgi:MHS family proline/betaine transporter-like MFS transporter